jgi:hypothetical protein
MTDTLFLYGAALAERIRELTRGAGVRCAVAYWGEGAREMLFADRAGGVAPRVVCDLVRGGTNPDEIEDLRGAGVEVRMAHMLHAKVYLSDAGAVVGSANASRNALHGADPEPLEAGVFVPPGAAAFGEADRYFEELWSNAVPVSDEALESARLTWRLRSHTRALVHPRAVPSGQRSFYDNLRDRPSVFDGFAIVVTTEEAEPEAARRAHDALNEGAAGVPPPPEGYDSFTGWKRDDFPELFINLHRGPRGGVYVTAGRLIFRYDEDDTHRTFLTENLRETDPRLAALRPFVLGNWRESFRGRPFPDVEPDAYEGQAIAEEISPRLR